MTVVWTVGELVDLVLSVTFVVVMLIGLLFARHLAHTEEETARRRRERR